MKLFKQKMPKSNKIRIDGVYPCARKFPLEKKIISNGIKVCLTVLISVLAIFTLIKAGSLTPSASPAATMHSLQELWDKIAGTTDNTSTTADMSGNVTQMVKYIAQHMPGGYTFGSSDAAKVLTTAGGTYNATLLTAANVRSGVAFGVSSTGTYGGSGWTYGSDDAAKVLTTADANNGVNSFNAANLSVGKVKSGVQFGVGPLSGEYPSATYPLPGDTAATDGTAADLLSGLEVWNKAGSLITGSMPTQTLSAANETLSAGYYAATTLSSVDTDLAVGKIKYGTTIFGFTGALSPYPNTPSGISGLNQSVCTSAGWTWAADSNYDTVEDDPICVNPNREAATKVWNTSVGNDNTFIGNYGCSGDTDGDGVGTLNTTLSGTVSENTGYGDDANVALAIADCKDGIRNLLTKAAVESAGYTAPDTDCTPDTNSCYNGPLTPKALIEWKGTRLPSHNDFFGVCGNGTNSTTFGNYGNQIGRTDNVIAANIGSWEWLSELHGYNSARIAGYYACSYFNYSTVTVSYGLRVVFRP